MILIKWTDYIASHILVFITLAQLALARLPLHQRSAINLPTFEWSNIEPSEDLVYNDCYSEGQDLISNQTPPSKKLTSVRTFRCARLLVPLDWQNTSNPNRVIIAVIKILARELQSNGDNRLTSHPGTIFFNPGGPGGSGVETVLRAGRYLQDMIDGEKNFEILSFDPRGVGFSSSANCFKDSLEDALWELKQRVTGQLDTGPEALKMKFASAQARGALCRVDKYNHTEDNIRAYMSTAYIARDMLEIFKRNEQLKESKGRSRLNASPVYRYSNAIESVIEDPVGKLDYIGLSYGTFLGNTFASLYPQHTGKMVLDGNVDADDSVGKWLTTSILDFESIWDVFYERCFTVKTDCALWRVTDSSPANIKTRVSSLLADIEQHPIPVISHDSSDLITYSDVKHAIYTSFYLAASFPHLATFLNGVYQRNISHLPPWTKPTISCSSVNSSIHLFDSSYDTMIATTCSDAQSISSLPLSSFEKYISFLRSQSPTAGPQSAELHLACLGWPDSLRSKWRFTGPFGTTVENNTQTPILFLNNRLDPVCPIRNAHKMAERYVGSVVLEQDAVGHCAFSSSMGDCVRGWVKRYFNEGVLPERNTVCPGGCQAFEKGCGFENRILWQGGFGEGNQYSFMDFER